MTRTPETITLDESTKMIAALTADTRTIVKEMKLLRNYTMFLLMLDAGLRVGEVTHLRCIDLWLGSQPVNAIAVTDGIAEKGCTRTVPCTPRLQLAIKKMEGIYWGFYLLLSNDFAFVGSKRSNPISARQIERIIKAVSKETIGREIWPHVLRHTFASRLMRTSPVPVVQQLLGHKQISSTQVYMHPNGDDLETAIKSLT